MGGRSATFVACDPVDGRPTRPDHRRDHRQRRGITPADWLIPLLTSSLAAGTALLVVYFAGRRLHHQLAAGEARASTRWQNEQDLERRKSTIARRMEIYTRHLDVLQQFAPHYKELYPRLQFERSLVQDWQPYVTATETAGTELDKVATPLALVASAEYSAKATEVGQLIE